MGIAVGVGGAIAATAVAADTIATVGFTLTAALEVTAAVGATLGVVGQITGNKDLSMAGMALGIVGGVGSLASAAGLFGDAASTAPLFGSAASSDVTSLAQDTSGFATDVGDTTLSGTLDPAAVATAGTDPGAAASAAAEAVPGGSSQDIIDSLGQVDPASATPQAAIASQTSQAAGSANDIVSGGDSGSVLAHSLDAPSAAGSSATSSNVASSGATANSLGDFQTPESIAELNSANPAGTATVQNILGPSSASSPGGLLSGLASFAKNNPTATYGLIQAAGSFASGAFSPVTPAQVNALNAQAAANNAAAGMTNTQIANIKSGVPGATVQRPGQAPTAQQPSFAAAPTAPVTGVPASVMPQIGMINRQAV